MVYLTMERTEKGADMSKVSPFLIKKCIDGAVNGSVEECKKLRSGILLIKCSEIQAEKLLKIKKLNNNISVKCEQHEKFNSSKGKIYSRDLCYLSDDEIISELSDQKVAGIKRIKRRDQVTKKITDEDVGIYILTFKACTIPDYIQIGYNNIAVKEFIPDPFRCFKCFRFGHSGENCKEESKKCPNCSNDAHCEKNESGSFEKCQNMSKCINCKKDHNSFYRKCEIFRKEKEIQFIRVTNRVSYFEARRRYKNEHPLPATFASVIKDQQKTVEKKKDANEENQSPEKSEEAAIQFEAESMETDELQNIPNVKKVIGKNGKEIVLIPKNTPKHKMDKIKNEQKKKVKYDVKPNSSHDESSE